MWYRNYAIPFQSRLGKQYVAYICETSYKEPVTLTGADDPFTTKEDDNVNIFTPIRKQTGYLRILDETGGMLLEQIMPQNNTEKMVVLMEGEKVAWKGFLCAEAFTQPWDSDVNVLEFPIKSVLAALDDVTVSISYSGSILRLSRLIAEGVNALCGGEPFESVTHIGSIVASQWMTKTINHSIFFNEESYQSGGDVVTTLEGVSYYNAISEIMKIIGLTARQEGNCLYFARYDGANSYNIIVNTMLWSDFYNIAIEAQTEITQGTMIPAADMLKALSFRKDNNEVAFTPGGRIAKVVLDIQSMPAAIFGLQLPETTEDDSPVSTTLVISADTDLGTGVIWPYKNPFDKILIQPHAVRNTPEVFVFNKYRHEGNATADPSTEFWAYTRLGYGTYEEFINNSPMSWPTFQDIGHGTYNNYSNEYTYNPARYNNKEIVTGAIPVRWCYSEHDSMNSATLVNGLLLIQKVLRLNDSLGTGDNECYSLSSLSSQTLNGGTFININFTSHAITGFGLKLVSSYPHIPSWQNYPQYDNFKYAKDGLTTTPGPTRQSHDISYEIACALCVGSKWWNGSSWQDSGVTFYISFKNDTIVSNKAAVGAVAEGEGGWFVPIPEDMEGTVTFKIMAWCHTNCVLQITPSSGYRDFYAYIRPYFKIIEGLSVGVTYTAAVTESERSTNTYRRVIMQSGFSDDKTIELTIGTDNNNKDSTPSFLKDTDGTTNITSLQYYSGGNVVNERPEEHLLNRMATYYNQVRRAFKATVETGIDLLTTRYTYLGRYFFGIDKKHDWRNDEQEVKFIEVN